MLEPLTQLTDLSMDKVTTKVAAAGLGWTYLAYAGLLDTRLVPHLVVCPFLLLTGHPCPFCGTTRSWNAMLHGHFSHAFALHPWAPLLLPLWIVLTIAATIELFGGPPKPYYQSERAQEQYRNTWRGNASRDLAADKRPDH